MKIRPSNRSDARAMARVYVKTWRDTYLSLIPFGYLYEMSESHHEHAFVRELDSRQGAGFVAEEAGRVVGFVSGGNERRGDRVYAGEIYALYVLKNFQRRGAGRGLVAALAGELNRAGTYSMLVRVLRENPCRRFYERLNGVYMRSERQSFSNTLVEVAVYGWPDTTLIGD